MFYSIKFGNKAIAQGRPILAYDILKEGLGLFPDHPEIRFRMALALSRNGSFGEAQAEIAKLLPELSDGTPLCKEAKSQWARILKDMWSRMPDGAERQQQGRACRDAY